VVKSKICFMDILSVKNILDDCVVRFNNKAFIENDPISIPHQFTKSQDIEITAFWTAMLAWGQRKTIINSAKKLFDLMDNAPHDFILNHQEHDRQRFTEFKHRTFQPIDAIYFIAFLQNFYQTHTSLETAFVPDNHNNSKIFLENALISFNKSFFSLPYAPDRTRKHVASPLTKSTCKRLCMFLRWMVRKDDMGVDFGIWQRISTADLMMPLDVHVERQARRLGLIEREQTDWLTVVELTNNLKQFDALDPVKYDYALFGMGILEKDMKDNFV
jgi:uncharacterized protein (TIGR02757 family)